MNHHIHAKNSAIIFGGQPSDYLKIHYTVDLSNIVSNLIYSRFFMHHFDIGGAIIESIFGKTIKNSDAQEVPTLEILKQHLIEDYDDLPKLEDWMKCFDGHQLKKITSMYENILNEELKTRAQNHKRLSRLLSEDLDLLISILDLSAFTKEESILGNFGKYMIFGHAAGPYLAEMIVGPYVGKTTMTTIDAFKELSWVKFGNTYSLLNFQFYIQKKSWMLAANYERKNIQNTLEKMQPGYIFTRIASEKEGDHERALAEFQNNHERRDND